MEKFNNGYMELKDYKLFIYEDDMLRSTIRKEYWKQMEDEQNWIPLNKKYYDEILDRGWLDEFISLNMFIDIENFNMKKIDISEKHQIGIIKFDDIEINYFIRFEMEVKNRYPLKRMLFVDYEIGEVYIIKHNS